MRTLRDAKIESRASRAKLPIGRDHWKTIEPGLLHLGYRRRSKDVSGLFLARRYIGGERYRIVVLGVADDQPDTGMSYIEAARAARNHRWDNPTQQRAGGITVADALANHLAYMKAECSSYRDAQSRIKHWIFKLAHRRVAELTKTEIQDWLNWVAAQPVKKRGGYRQPNPTKKSADILVRRNACAANL